MNLKTTRTTKEPDVRRRELMDAAIRVFAEKGISRSTVADITKAAGVAKGTFYLYYTSKEHLLGALKERFVGEILEHSAAVYSRVGREDWENILDATVSGFVDFFIERQDAVHVMVQEGVTPETQELFAECELKVEEMIAAGIRLGMTEGSFHTSDPEMAARLIHAALEGALKNALLYGGGIDRERFIAAGKEFVRKILAPPA